MTYANEEHRDERELIRFAIAGQNEAWLRLNEKIYNVIDSIVDRVQKVVDVNPEAAKASASIMKDLTSIAGDWVKAKVERPSLENTKLRAEIASEYAEAKKRWAEALKAEAEAKKIISETQTQEVLAAMDNLERLLRLQSLMSNMTFTVQGKDGHLLIGPRPDQLGLPAGDTDSLSEEPHKADEEEMRSD